MADYNEFKAGDQHETFGRFPVSMQCPYCNANMQTRTRTFPNLKTLIACGITLVVFWPLFWLPLIIDNCKETEHTCTNCEENVGSVDAFSDCCVTTSDNAQNNPPIVI